MYIKEFQILNFKSYRDSGVLKFGPGFNIITGQNNAGKTALLQAITLEFGATPHRSIRTVPTPGAEPEPTSFARITFNFAQPELHRLLRGGEHFIPSPQQNFLIPGNGPFDGSQHTAKAFLKYLLELPEFSIAVRVSRRLNGSEFWEAEEPTLGGLYPTQPVAANERNFVVFSLDFDGRVQTVGGSQTNKNRDFSIVLAQRLKSHIYRFWAERFNIGECPVGTSSVLLGNAGNLPEVLDVLQGNPVKFRDFVDLVHEVLPQVRNISLLPQSNNQKQIKVWAHDHERREDLAVPLSQCGSGIGQVLAMLYVVTSADHPQTIIVDEPQSFLHPGAIRKLIEVLKRYPQHQYILATHSPAVIAACDPITTIMLRQVDGETLVTEVDIKDSGDLKLYLSEIGARLSDIFGADDVLWVEGQTEELCFPRILKEIAHRSLMGTAVLGIRQTGDLARRDGDRIFALYRRLTEGRSLLPPAVAFVLDRECLTNQEIDELHKRSQGLAVLLPRRMYENYLLDAPAIAKVVNQIPDFRTEPVS